MGALDQVNQLQLELSYSGRKHSNECCTMPCVCLCNCTSIQLAKGLALLEAPAPAVCKLTAVAAQIHTSKMQTNSFLARDVDLSHIAGEHSLTAVDWSCP